MLVLTRKLQEKITIAGNITVTVLRVKGQSVRIGIEAPRNIRVVRGELPVEADAEGEASSETAAAEPALVSSHSEEDGKEADQTQDGHGLRLPQRRKFNRHAAAPLTCYVAART